jgi:hypothetical protein
MALLLYVGNTPFGSRLIYPLSWLRSFVVFRIHSRQVPGLYRHFPPNPVRCVIHLSSRHLLPSSLAADAHARAHTVPDESWVVEDTNRANIALNSLLDDPSVYATDCPVVSLRSNSPQNYVLIPYLSVSLMFDYTSQYYCHFVVVIQPLYMWHEWGRRGMCICYW